MPAIESAEAACVAALEAARQALEACAALEAAGTPVRIGIGLRVGPLSYGNIGSETRLDFTCVGPAVNLAARLQSLASTEG